MGLFGQDLDFPRGAVFVTSMAGSEGVQPGQRVLGLLALALLQTPIDSPHQAVGLQAVQAQVAGIRL
ncbi:hypothetical protein D9M71_473200 [compost metagenome]